MLFTTLAERFEAQSKDIYNKLSPSSDQLVVVKPDTTGVFGSASRVKNDTRAVPTVSVLRDTRRVSKFLASSEGRLFLGKQVLLQTGNTFENTRLFNPASTLANVVPFLHVRRHIPTFVAASVFVNPNASGLLQNSTVDDITSKFRITGQIQSVSTDRDAFVPAVRSIAKTYLTTKLKNSIRFLPTEQNYYKSRPEYNMFGYEKGQLFGTGPVLFDVQPLSQRSIAKLSVVANIKNKALSFIQQEAIGPAFLAERFGNTRMPLQLQRDPRDGSIVTPARYEQLKTAGIVKTDAQLEEDKKIDSFASAAMEFKRNFLVNNPNQKRLKSKYFTETPNSADADVQPGINPVYVSAESKGNGLSDPYNIAPIKAIDASKLDYVNIVTSNEDEKRNTDIIKFIFREVDNSNPVYFRALLSSIKENVKTEFSEQRYVGRTERFVTYGGAKRGVNIAFNIVAFSQREADGMWNKVNYLTGLAFPKDVQNGFMVPPLFKMTIGGLYENQPCYIETLDYDFLDETITFDTDREVPFAINVTMQLSILEKRSKFYDSPFYAITENALLNALLTSPANGRI